MAWLVFVRGKILERCFVTLYTEKDKYRNVPLWQSSGLDESKDIADENSEMVDCGGLHGRPFLVLIR